MPDQPGQNLHLTGAAPEGKAGGSGEQAILHAVNINTTSTSASLTIYQGPFPNNGTPSTTGTKVGVFDCSGTPRNHLFDIRSQGGIYAVLTPAATGADVSITVI